MAPKCKICTHSECHVINALIRDGSVSMRQIGVDYGISYMSVTRHRDKCLGMKAKAEAQAARIANPDQVPVLRHVNDIEPMPRRMTPTLMDELMDIREDCMRIKDSAMNGNKPDPYLALAAGKEQRAVAEIMIKYSLLAHRRKEKAGEKAEAPPELTSLLERILERIIE